MVLEWDLQRRSGKRSAKLVEISRRFTIVSFESISAIENGRFESQIAPMKSIIFLEEEKRQEKNTC